MLAITTFCDSTTGVEIYDTQCDVVDAESVYQKGKELSIKGVEYVVERTVRCINGSIQYKVYVKAK